MKAKRKAPKQLFVSRFLLCAQSEYAFSLILCFLCLSFSFRSLIC